MLLLSRHITCETPKEIKRFSSKLKSFETPSVCKEKLHCPVQLNTFRIPSNAYSLRQVPYEQETLQLLFETGTFRSKDPASARKSCIAMSNSTRSAFLRMRTTFVKFHTSKKHCNCFSKLALSVLKRFTVRDQVSSFTSWRIHSSCLRLDCIYFFLRVYLVCQR